MYIWQNIDEPLIYYCQTECIHSKSTCDVICDEMPLNRSLT